MCNNFENLKWYWNVNHNQQFPVNMNTQDKKKKKKNQTQEIGGLTIKRVPKNGFLRKW